jgi:hypothetical protein
MLSGKQWTIVIHEERDLERIISHHSLTTLTIDAAGLECSCSQTAGPEMPIHMLLTLLEQDIRHNAQHIDAESADPEQTHSELAKFFASLTALRVVFPWTLVLRCPLAKCTVEGEGSDDRVSVIEYVVEQVNTLCECQR